MHAFQTLRGGNEEVKEKLMNLAQGRKGGKKEAKLEDAGKRCIIIPQIQSHSQPNAVLPRDKIVSQLRTRCVHRHKEEEEREEETYEYIRTYSYTHKEHVRKYAWFL